MKYSELNFRKLQKVDKKGFVLIPVGCLEVHGPDLPFGSDTYLAKAVVHLLGKKVDSIQMPAVCYGHSAVTKDIPGTISIGINEVASYIQGIIGNLIKQKFKKIVIINIHKDNDLPIKLAVNKIFEIYKVPVLYINPYLNFTEKKKKIFSNTRNSYKETSLILASLKILKVSKIAGKIKPPSVKYKKPAYLKKLLDLGYIRYEYLSEMQHISPEEDASEEEGIRYMDLITDKIVNDLSCLDDYISSLEK